jgi:hypothetical protein
MLILEKQLTQRQIDVANRLYDNRLDQWRLSDMALYRLRDKVLGFDDEACLLKSLAINQLYGTRILAIIPMSNHVHDVLSRLDATAGGIELVDKIAAYRSAEGKVIRRISFASKFCHFLIDDRRFPIYDEAVQQAIRFHLGGAQYLTSKDPDKKYQVFFENLQRLRKSADIHGKDREIDHYLWIVGMYMRWKKPNTQINAELRRFFSEPSLVEKAELNEVLPENFREL